MSSNKKISIITPCFNASSYIKACIDSILKQTIDLSQLELILIDDASTDCTLSILRDYETAYPELILLIPLPENRGQGHARNLALAYASGIYVMYVDADDTIAPWTSEVLLKEMSVSSCDVLEFNFTRSLIDMGQFAGSSTTATSYFTVTDLNSQLLLSTSIAKYGIICNKIYKHSFLSDNNIINAECLAHEDTIFSELVLLHAQKYGYFPKTLYYYRPNPNSTMLKTQIYDWKQFDRLKVQMQFLSECEQRGFFPDYYLAIETMFIRIYYMDTLLSVLQRFPLAPLEPLLEMQQTVRGCFPRYISNPLLTFQLSKVEQALLSTIEIDFTEEIFFKLQRELF